MSNKSELQSNNVDLQAILDAVNALPEEGSGGIDTSDATATASDIEQGKTAYVNNQKIEGTLPVDYPYTEWGIADECDMPILYLDENNPMDGEPYLKLNRTNSVKSIVSEDSIITTVCHASELGDATAEDVVEGKTFTSVNGLKITGTASGGSGGLPAGVTKLASGTITPPADGNTISVTHGLGVTPNFCVWELVDVDYSNSVDTSIAVAGASFLIDMKYSSSSSTLYKVAYMVRGYNTSSNTGGTTSGYASNSYFSNTACALVGTSTYKIKTGYTYRWVCGVMEV